MTYLFDDEPGKKKDSPEPASLPIDGRRIAILILSIIVFFVTHWWMTHVLLKDAYR